MMSHDTATKLDITYRRDSQSSDLEAVRRDSKTVQHTAIFPRLLRDPLRDLLVHRTRSIGLTNRCCRCRDAR